MILAVCANVCIDEYIRPEGRTVLPAGKGINVAVSMKNIGLDVECLMFMPIKSASLFDDYLSDKGVKAHYVFTGGEARINKKVIDAYGHITEYSGTCEAVESKHQDEFLAKFAELARRADSVVISGSLPVGSDPAFYRRLIAAAGGDKCWFDSSREALELGLESKPFFIKPNIYEFNALTGTQNPDVADNLRDCKALIETGVKYVLLSLGGDGAIITDGVQSYYAKADSDDIINTTGAGDCMLSAAVQAMRVGYGIKDILIRAVAAATVKIEHNMPFIKDTKFLDSLGRVSIKELL